MAEVAAIILAAGRSSRWRAAGGAEVSKLVAEYRGEPLVRGVARATLASRARPIVVVTGHARADVEAALADLPLSFAFNPDFASGLASSLKTGVAALPGAVAGVVVLLGDMPDVDAGAIDRVVEVFGCQPAVLAAAPVFRGRRGNPVLLSRALFGALARLEGDEGARSILRDADPGNVVEIVFDNVAVATDIDTPDDLKAARRLL